MSRFVLYREVFFIQRLKCTGVIGIGTSIDLSFTEVFFIWSVLYRRFHCIAMNYTHFWKLKGDNVVLLGFLVETSVCIRTSTIAIEHHTKIQK